MGGSSSKPAPVPVPAPVVQSVPTSKFDPFKLGLTVLGKAGALKKAFKNLIKGDPSALITTASQITQELDYVPAASFGKRRHKRRSVKRSISPKKRTSRKKTRRTKRTKKVVRKSRRSKKV